MSESRKKSVFVQIFIGVAVAFLVGGTSPWWWEEIFGRQDSPPKTKTILEDPWKNDTPDQKPPVNERHTKGDDEVISTGRFVTTTFGAKLFRGPDLFEPRIADLPKGKRFRVIREHKDGPHVWFEIAYENKTGWVPAMSVTLEN